MLEIEQLVNEKILNWSRPRKEEVAA
jgi:hypothetical protein